VEALWLWVVPASRSSCVVLLLPMENPIPRFPSGRIFLFFKSPGGIGIGRRRDLDIITCVELNITLTHHRRALQQKIILCQHLNLISA
jgi:hypothetical protein